MTSCPEMLAASNYTKNYMYNGIYGKIIGLKRQKAKFRQVTEVWARCTYVMITYYTTQKYRRKHFKYVSIKK